MIRVIWDGDGHYRLLDHDDRELGWIRGRAIGVRGFASEEDARAAAPLGRAALGNVLAHHSGRVLPPARAPLRLVHDGAHEWVSDGRVPVARLGRPRDAGGTFSLEWVLPQNVPDAVAVDAARRLTMLLAPAPRIDASVGPGTMYVPGTPLADAPPPRERVAAGEHPPGSGSAREESGRSPCE